MIGAAGRERRHMPARLQDAQDILPQVHVERDPVESKLRFMKPISYGGSVTTESTLLSGKEAMRSATIPLV